MKRFSVLPLCQLLQKSNQLSVAKRKIMNSTNIFKYSLLTSAIILAGCGGSSSSSKPVPELENSAPTLTVANAETNENTAISVSASATDSDGSISGYQWQVTSGHTLELSGSASNTISFIAPSVTADGDTVTLSVIATDNDGASSTATANIVINNVSPTVELTDVNVDEKANVTLAAQVNGMGDTIASYNWQVNSGPNVDLGDANTAEISFSAPEISEDAIIELALTVTDTDGDTATATSNVNVNQLTIPLTISGLATDSPIANAQISVNVAGRDITVDATANDSGEYTVELLLDDSEAEAFISIEAKGVADQHMAGLISLLGTAGELSELAGEDNVLTEDEGFSVNVTNITTAKYALAKLANNGDAITSDEQLATLSESLNYDEVITLATAIKVAIDKANDNPDLALPSGITDTLALVENTAATQAYVQGVQSTVEFDDAQEEMYQDENLFDMSSSWQVPNTYYFTPNCSLCTGDTYRFNNNNTGSHDGLGYTWTESEGVITATLNDNNAPKISFENHEINNIGLQVEVHFIDETYTFTRLSTGERSDVLLSKSYQLVHYPNGELADYRQNFTTTSNATKNTAIIDISHTGAGIAYLPYIDSNDDITDIDADEFILNTDGTGHATVSNFDFTWAINNGALEFSVANDSTNDEYVARFYQLSSNTGANVYAMEFDGNSALTESFGEHNGDHIGWGNIVDNPMSFDSATVAGIYSYDNATFSDDPLSHFWFELSENGDADTKSSSDSNSDGIITEDEIYTMYGRWHVNTDGKVTITRTRTAGGNYSPDCRIANADDCVLYHERTWQLIGQSSNKFDLFHKHDFKFSNLDWGDDTIYYDNRSVYKVSSAPITAVASTVKTSVTKKSLVITDKFLKLEPTMR